MTEETPKRRGPGRPPIDQGMEGGNLHSGVSLNWLAEHFHMAKATVKKRLASVHPIRKTRNSSLYEIRQAAAYLVEPKVDISQYIQSLRPNDLPPLLQDTYWSAMIKRQKWEENAGQLWRTDAVLEVLGDAFKRINGSVKLWEDDIDRVEELTDNQRAVLRQMADGLLADLHEALVTMPSEKATKSQLAELEDMKRQAVGEISDQDFEDIEGLI